MNRTPDPVRLKIERADRHRREALRSLETFRKRKPYRVRKDLQERGGEIGYWVTADRAEQPPMTVALALGDYVQDLRASLDYLVGTMRPDGPTGKSAFPNFPNWVQQPSFQDRAKEKLAGIHDEAKQIIERMQPYDGLRERALWRGLRALETLGVVDKHRVILLATTLLAPDYVWKYDAQEKPVSIMQSIASPDREAHWWLSGEGNRYGEPEFTVEVTLRKPGGFSDDWPDWLSDWPLDSLIEEMNRVVRYQVLPELEKFRQPS